MKGGTGWGVVAGGATLLAAMLAASGIGIGLGWLQSPGAEPVDLGPWLRLEIVAGGLASVLSGRVCRRVAGSRRAPVVLAAVVFVIGLLEAAELLGAAARGVVVAPAYLVLLAPVVTAVGVLAGGVLRVDRADLVARLRLRGDDVLDLRRGIGYWTSGLVLLAASGLALFILPALEPGPRTTVVASALALDFTVAVPAIVYYFLVRTRRLPWIVIVPAFVVGYALATATIPRQHHDVLDVLRFIVVPLELVLVGYLVLRARRIFADSRQQGDFATRFRATAREALGARVPADILTTEVAILYHAFRPRSASRRQEGTFTVHREIGYAGILIGLLMALVVETVALHLLVSQWSAIAAWVLSALSAYAAVWLLGDFRAFSARPTRITSTHLSLRLGLRWEAEIALDRIVDIEIGPGHDPPTGDVLVLSLIGRPNLRLRLTEPVEVTGMYGLRRVSDDIRLRIDDAPSLRHRLLPGGAPSPGESSPSAAPRP